VRSGFNRRCFSTRLKPPRTLATRKSWREVGGAAVLQDDSQGNVGMDGATDQDSDSVEVRAAIACGLLREAASAGLPDLRTLNRGKALAVSLTTGVLGWLPFGRGGYRVVAGRTVWRLGAKALDFGITEDGALGITDDGELVRMSTWLQLQGQRPVDPRGQGRRFRERLDRAAQSRGCDAAMSVTPVEAFGEPQPETRFNREFRNVFHLDGTGRLVFGYPGATQTAEEWFARCISGPSLPT